MNRLRRQQERIRSEEEAAYHDFQEASEALEKLQSRLRASSSKLVRLRKQQKLLEDRGFSILDRELSSEDVAALERRDQKLLEQLAAGEPSDPEGCQDGRSPKRPRAGSADPVAPRVAESAASSGEPSTHRLSKSPGPVDLAHPVLPRTTLPEVADSLLDPSLWGDPVSWEGLGFADGIR